MSVPQSPVQGRAGPARRPPPRQRSLIGPLLFVLLVLGLVVAMVGAARPIVVDAIIDFASERDSLLRQAPIRALVATRVGDSTDIAADPTASQRAFEVRLGDTAATIARRLLEAGLVRSHLAFLVVVYDTGRQDALQAGVYQLSAAMTPREIAATLERAAEEQTVLRVIEGWRLTEIAAAVADAFPDITPEAFLAEAVVGERSRPMLAGLDAETPLEGFLYPDTYFLTTDATARQIVELLLDTFERRAGATLQAAAARQATTIYDLVKLASLVEREARDRAESADIAGVYANRLSIEMKLDADPTIQYALGEWRELLLVDLEIDSPYNTYRVAGLPPTPICSPGLAALEAAAAPADHEYLFFVADASTGRHLFARTLEEHEANRVKVGNR